MNCVESSSLWHARLGHLNFGALKNMMNLELIPKHTIEKNFKCQVFVSAKQIRKPFHNIFRDSLHIEGGKERLFKGSYHMALK